jgi:hypothetical protein
MTYNSSAEMMVRYFQLRSIADDTIARIATVSASGDAEKYGLLNTKLVIVLDTMGTIGKLLQRVGYN